MKAINYIGIIGLLLFIISLFIMMFFQLHQLSETFKIITGTILTLGIFLGLVWMALFEKYN